MKAVPAVSALLAGLLLPLALAPFNLWPLAIVSVAILFWCIQSAGAGEAFWLGWLYGVGKYALGVSWVYVSIHQYGHASLPLAAFLVLIFVASLAFFPALAIWFYARFLRMQSGLLSGISFAVVLVLLEWILTWVMTGFPWLYHGYAFLETPLAHWAPLGGVLCVSFMVLLSGALLVVLIREPRSRGMAAVLLLLPWVGGALLSLPHWVTPVASAQVVLVQGNIDQESKWRQQSVQPIIDRYLRLSEGQWGKDLIIWPEAALTLFRFQAEPLLQRLNRRGQQSGTTLVLGIPDLDVVPGEGRVFRNSAIALGTGSGQYIKQRLVPFGEYVPLQSLLRGLIEFFDLPMSHAEPGAPGQPPLRAGDWRLAMAICYEIVYPELVRQASAEADLIVTLSNDSWFGRSIGPLQHMQMARMRALENGRYLLRGTNNGVTAIVDEQGAITRRLPQFVEGVLEGEFTVMAGSTPYTRFGFLPWLLVLWLWVVSGMIAVLHQQYRHPKPQRQ